MALFCVMGCSLSVADEVVPPEKRWNALTSRNFNIYFKENHRQWAEKALTEAEYARDLVHKELSQVVDRQINIFVVDPFKGNSSYALPSMEQPSMVLFVTPPTSDSYIGQGLDWQRLSVLHEYLHLIHLSEKYANTWRHHLEDGLPAPETAKEHVPEWIAEGYAIHMESKLTESGRLNNEYLKVLFDEYVSKGALPSYAELFLPQESYDADVIRNLTGGLFFQWLESGFGQESFESFWRAWRTDANQVFDGLFTEFFGKNPRRLYQQFVANRSYEVLARRHAHAQILNDAAKVHLFQGSIGSPSLNPSGSKLCVAEEVILEQGKIRELAVYEMQVEGNGAGTRHLQPVARQTRVNHANIYGAQWLDDHIIIYSASDRNDEDVYSDNLYAWDISKNEVLLVKQGSHIRRFDISSDKKYIAAEKTDNGRSDVVLIKIANINEEIPLAVGQPGQVFDFPRMNPVGDKIAYLKSTSNTNWQLIIYSFKDNQALEVPMPRSTRYLSYLTWNPSGDRLYFLAGVDRTVDIYSYALESGEIEQVTHNLWPVSWPLVLSDQDLMYFVKTVEGSYLVSDNLLEKVVPLAKNALPASKPAVREEKPAAPVWSKPPMVNLGTLITQRSSRASSTTNRQIASEATSRQGQSARDAQSYQEQRITLPVRDMAVSAPLTKQPKGSGNQRLESSKAKRQPAGNHPYWQSPNVVADSRRADPAPVPVPRAQQENTGFRDPAAHSYNHVSAPQQREYRQAEQMPVAQKPANAYTEATPSGRQVYPPQAYQQQPWQQRYRPQPYAQPEYSGQTYHRQPYARQPYNQPQPQPQPLAQPYVQQPFPGYQYSGQPYPQGQYPQHPYASQPVPVNPPQTVPASTMPPSQQGHSPQDSSQIATTAPSADKTPKKNAKPLTAREKAYRRFNRSRRSEPENEVGNLLNSIISDVEKKTETARPQNTTRPMRGQYINYLRGAEVKKQQRIMTLALLKDALPENTEHSMDTFFRHRKAKMRTSNPLWYAKKVDTEGPSLDRFFETERNRISSVVQRELHHSTLDNFFERTRSHEKQLNRHQVAIGSVEQGDTYDKRLPAFDHGSKRLPPWRFGMPAFAASAQNNCWVNAGRQYDLDPWLLYSIADAQSDLQPGRVTDYGSGRRMGLMQIDSNWLEVLEPFDIDEEALLNPCTNIHVAAWGIRRHGQNWLALSAFWQHPQKTSDALTAGRFSDVDYARQRMEDYVSLLGYVPPGLEAMTNQPQLLAGNTENLPVYFIDSDFKWGEVFNQSLFDIGRETENEVEIIQELYKLAELSGEVLQSKNMVYKICSSFEKSGYAENAAAIDDLYNAEIELIHLKRKAYFSDLEFASLQQWIGDTRNAIKAKTTPKLTKKSLPEKFCHNS